MQQNERRKCYHILDSPILHQNLNVHKYSQFVDPQSLCLHQWPFLFSQQQCQGRGTVLLENCNEAGHQQYNVQKTKKNHETYKQDRANFHNK